MSPTEYIDTRTDKLSSGCWVWKGFTTPNGYSHSKLNGVRKLAHRFSYEIFKGEIPEGYQIDHLCKVRHCINPDHLEAVTPQENIARSNVGKELLARTHCGKGHEYNDKNTYYVKRNRVIVGRSCRACHNIYEKNRYHKRRLR